MECGEQGLGLPCIDLWAVECGVQRQGLIAQSRWAEVGNIGEAGDGLRWPAPLTGWPGRLSIIFTLGLCSRSRRHKIKYLCRCFR